MNLPHRIAAGGIIIHENKILLVKYNDNSSGSYLVAPGGGLKLNEDIKKAIVREVFEETNLNVEPISVVMIEDIISSQYKMCKIWMNCKLIDGFLKLTDSAIKEGIVDVGWYSREQIENEKVYPSIILQKEWNKLNKTRNHIFIDSVRNVSF